LVVGIHNIGHETYFNRVFDELSISTTSLIPYL